MGHHATHVKLTWAYQEAVLVAGLEASVPCRAFGSARSRAVPEESAPPSPVVSARRRCLARFRAAASGESRAVSERGFLRLTWVAAGHLGRDPSDPFQVVDQEAVREADQEVALVAGHRHQGQEVDHLVPQVQAEGQAATPVVPLLPARYPLGAAGHSLPTPVAGCTRSGR